MVTDLVRKKGEILKKSLGRPYPLICTGVNGENLQFVKYSLYWLLKDKEVLLTMPDGLTGQLELLLKISDL